MNEIGTWESDQKLVLNELKRNTETIEALRNDIGDLKVEVAMLKVKSGAWGVIGGLVPVLIAVGLKLL